MATSPSEPDSVSTYGGWSLGPRLTSRSNEFQERLPATGRSPGSPQLDRMTAPTRYQVLVDGRNTPISSASSAFQSPATGRSPGSPQFDASVRPGVNQSPVDGRKTPTSS